MKLYKDQSNVFWLLTINGWWNYHMITGTDGAHNWCWYGVREFEGIAYPELSPSTPLEFLVCTGKNINGMRMITCVDGGRAYRHEVIKLK